MIYCIYKGVEPFSIIGEFNVIITNINYWDKNVETSKLQFIENFWICASTTIVYLMGG